MLCDQLLKKVAFDIYNNSLILVELILLIITLILLFYIAMNPFAKPHIQ
jgi:hypothetical protein